MKHILILTAAILVITVSAFSQQDKSLYWVVETNAQIKNYSVVRFYNLDNQLVHEVAMDHVRIDITKPKHQRKLNQLLKNYQDRVASTSKRNKSKRSI
jgi:endonuclease/exonuclease/phosphatase (EEP) superfamily protein YafD